MAEETKLNRADTAWSWARNNKEYFIGLVVIAGLVIMIRVLKWMFLNI